MKKILLSLIVAFVLNACHTDDNIPEIAKLPQATQTGANTIGCLVNGKALLPYGLLETKSVCQYDGMNFAMSVGEKKNNEIHIVNVISYNEILEEGKTYQLKEYTANSKYGQYAILTDTGKNDYYTNTILTGELKITRYDFDHAFISGTFWFDAIDSYGEKVEVREGRFDKHFE